MTLSMRPEDRLPPPVSMRAHCFGQQDTQGNRHPCVHHVRRIRDHAASCPRNNKSEPTWSFDFTFALFIPYSFPSDSSSFQL